MKTLVLFIICFATNFSWGYSINTICECPKNQIDESIPYSIVFVYIARIPSYVSTAVSQAKLFNPQAKIYIISNKGCIDNVKSQKTFQDNVLLIPIETLKKTDHHILFDKECALNNTNGFWKYTLERFFLIDELMNKFQLRNVFQIECDVMLYADLSEFLPVLENSYPNMAGVFENDYLGSVSFVYFKNPEGCENFAKFIPTKTPKCDMAILALYKNATLNEIDYLPTIFKEYCNDYTLISKIGQTTNNPWKFYNHIDEFNSIFDSDLLGAYIAHHPGNIGNQVVYNPANFSIVWLKDDKNRNIPYAKYKDKLFRINTLHICQKNLEKYYSLKG